MRCLTVNTLCGTYGKYQYGGGDISSICYPTNDLIQYLSVRDESYFRDTWTDSGTYDARLTNSYALEFDRTKDQGIVSDIHVQGSTPIYFKFGVMFYDFINDAPLTKHGGNAVFSTVFPDAALVKGFAMITSPEYPTEGYVPRMGLQVYNEGGFVPHGAGDVVFEPLLEPMVYYEMELIWSGLATDYAYLKVNGVEYTSGHFSDSSHTGGTFTPSSVGNAWEGDSTDPLKLASYSNPSNVNDNYNLNGILTYVNLKVNNYPDISNIPLTMGNGDIVLSRRTGAHFFIKNYDYAQWIKQPFYHENITNGCSIKPQLVFNTNDHTNVQFSPIDVRIDNFTIEIDVNLKDYGGAQVLIQAHDGLYNRNGFWIKVLSDGRIEFVIYANSIGKSVILPVGSFKFTNLVRVVVITNATDMKLSLIYGNGAIITNTTTYGVSMSSLATMTTNLVGASDTSGFLSANGLIKRIVYSSTSTGVILDKLRIYDAIYLGGTVLTVISQNLNHDFNYGKFYIPSSQVNHTEDIHGDVLTNPAIPDRHNGCETCITQQTIPALYDYDPDHVWFYDTTQLYYGANNADVLRYNNVLFNHNHFYFEFVVQFNEVGTYRKLLDFDGWGNNELFVILTASGELRVYSYNDPWNSEVVDVTTTNTVDPDVLYKLIIFADGNKVYFKTYEYVDIDGVRVKHLLWSEEHWVTYPTREFDVLSPAFKLGNASINDSLDGTLYYFKYFKHVGEEHKIDVTINNDVVDTGVHTYSFKIFSTETTLHKAKDVPFNNLPVAVGDYAYGNKRSLQDIGELLWYSVPRTLQENITIDNCKARGQLLPGYVWARNPDGTILIDQYGILSQGLPNSLMFNLSDNSQYIL